MRHRSRISVLAVLLCGGLAACAAPVGKAGLLDFLADGTTPKEEAFLRLGEPSATFEREQILTYRLAKDEAGYILGAPGSYRYVGSAFSLVLVFGENGVLRRHALVAVRAGAEE
jgi:hypothetical protein